VLPDGITCQDAVDFLKTNNDIRQFLVTDDKQVKGIITLDMLLSKLISGAVTRMDRAEKIMIKQFMKVTESITLGKLSRILEKELFAVIVNNDDNSLIGIVDQSDLFDFISMSDTAQNGIM